MGKGSLSLSFDLSPKSDVVHDEDVSDPTGQGLRPAPSDGRRGHQGRHQVPPLPFDQKAFAGVLTTGIPNFFRRVKGEFLNVVPPFVIGYLIFDYYEKEHDRLQRKQPGQFDNDV